MSINLTIEWDHPSAIANFVQYARIDNTVSPVFTTVAPNVPGASGTATIAMNIPNGQYQVNMTPIYADGRTCTANVSITPACPGLISINAVLNSGNIVVSYLAPSQAPKVRITVNYPNGGSFIANYVNDGNNIVIALPVGQTGLFTVSGQSVCDEGSGFYSAPSTSISLTVTAFNVTINNFAPGIVINTVTGISGFTLGSLLNYGDTGTGSHIAFYGDIAVTFTGSPSSASYATVQINGTIIQCQNVGAGPGGTVNFSAANYQATDQIQITFNQGTCP
jgi:hypothetical protein